MELDQVVAQLNWRAAIKLFDSEKKVSDSDFDKLLEVLRLSSSSMGLQPWKFVVVKNPDIRAQLKVAAHDQAQVVDASHFIVLCAKTNLTLNDVDTYLELVSEIRGVKLEDLAGYKKTLTNFVGSKSPEDLAVWATKQVYIALGNLLTACAVAGIDACPMEGFDAKKYNEILNLGADGLQSVVACAIGYRSSSDRSMVAKKVRYAKKNLVIEK